MLATAPSHRGTDLPLPPDYSLEQDVLVLAGASASAWLPELARRGLGRVVVYAPAKDAAPSTQVRVASSGPDVLALILDFEPPARQITVHRLPGEVGDAEFEALKKVIEFGGLNRATFANSGPTWVRHAFANLPALAQSPSVECLAGCFAGAACVLVSPGPSLSKNVGVLQKLAERVLIIAGNRALMPLRAAGIVPDIVVVADALDLSYQLGGGLLDGVPAVVLDMVAHPAVCRLPVSRRFFFSAVGEIQRSTLAGIGDGGILPSGGSVATVALALALHLGAGPILMVGQDLALDGNQYYIPSAPDGATRIELDGGVGTFQNSSRELRRAMSDAGGPKPDERSVQQFIKVPGYHGGEVYTSLQFDAYRRWFGNMARAQTGKVRIVNCTEGGARIEHVEQARLADVAAELPAAPVDAARILEERYRLQPQKERAQAVERHIKELQRWLRESFEEAERCERLSRQVQRAPEQLERLDRAEAKLTEAVRKLPFAIALASAEVERARRAGANAASLAESLDASRALYEVIKRAVLLARPALADALQRLKQKAA